MSFNTITHPTTGVRYSIFSSPGRNLLKNYLRTYKSGGADTEKQTWTGCAYKDPYAGKMEKMVYQYPEDEDYCNNIKNRDDKYICENIAKGHIDFKDRFNSEPENYSGDHVFFHHSPQSQFVLGCFS